MTLLKNKQWLVRMPAFILAGMLGAAILTGCKSESKMAPNEEANFKGGPMPADFMAKHGNPSGPPPAAKK